MANFLASLKACQPVIASHKCVIAATFGCGVLTETPADASVKLSNGSLSLLVDPFFQMHLTFLQSLMQHN